MKEGKEAGASGGKQKTRPTDPEEDGGRGTQSNMERQKRREN